MTQPTGLGLLVPLAALLAMTAVQPAQARGCLKGAAVGAVAGHVAGHHAVVGAVAGCAIGHHRAKQQEQQRRLQQQPARPAVQTVPGPGPTAL